MTDQHPNWTQLLTDAVNTPGQISEAYSAFHNYSMLNALDAMFQCAVRGIPVGPISTYAGWQKLGRQVRKGQKAIWLTMPVQGKATRKNDEGQDETVSYTRFVYRPNWFVLSQTDGEPVQMPTVPEFDFDLALETLQITRVAFDLTDGNAQGFAHHRNIAISPVAVMPWKTLFHEVAHVLLGHTEEHSLSDSETITRDLREVEAESVALICCESLNLPGSDFSRGYVQHWLQGSEIPDKSAQRIFAVASQILKAGQAKPKAMSATA